MHRLYLFWIEIIRLFVYAWPMKTSKILSYKKIFEKKLFLRFLSTLQCPGTFALVNKKDKKVYVHSSFNVLKSIECSLLKFPAKDRIRMNIELLGECVIDDILIEKYKWMEHYKTLGYTLYNRQTAYTLRPRVMTDEYNIFVQVELVTAGKRAIPVAKFPTMEKAQAFMDTSPIYDILLLIHNKNNT